MRKITKNNGYELAYITFHIKYLFIGGCFHDGGGEVALLQQLAVQSVHAHLGGENLRVSLAAEEDDPLVEHAQALHLYRTGAGAVGVQGDAVKEPHIHRVEAPVEHYGLHVNVRIEQFRLAALHGLGAVKHILAAGRGVEAQILDTVLIGRYSVL